MSPKTTGLGAESPSTSLVLVGFEEWNGLNGGLGRKVHEHALLEVECMRSGARRADITTVAIKLSAAVVIKVMRSSRLSLHEHRQRYSAQTGSYVE